MARRKQQNIVAVLESYEALEAAIAASDDFLTVVDFHEEWCGPATVMENVYRSVFVTMDRAEERVKIYTLCKGKLSADQLKALGLATGTCKPVFNIYNKRVKIGQVAGINAPELEAFIVENARSLD